jgi:hypothetical protein
VIYIVSRPDGVYFDQLSFTLPSPWLSNAGRIVITALVGSGIAEVPGIMAQMPRAV